MAELDDLIARLGLEPHPEGGWWCQTWRDGGHDRATRGAGSSILYLLAAEERSRWHRVTDAAEVWHHHAGAPLQLDQAPGDEGPVTTAVLGADVAVGQQPQLVVPAGWWQSAATLGPWTLAGCTVAPAFIDDVFEMAPERWAPGSAASPSPRP